jgi:Helix-turn-helix domain
MTLLPKQYTIAQVAEYFHRDEQTIRRWITDGKFPHAYKVADGWFILEIDVKRLVKQMQSQSAAKMPGLAKAPPVRRSSGKGFVGGWK